VNGLLQKVYKFGMDDGTYVLSSLDASSSICVTSSLNQKTPISTSPSQPPPPAVEVEVSSDV
jgi:hypothetical protein